MVRSSQLARQSALTVIWAMVSVACSLLSGIATARMPGPSDRGTLAVTLTVVGLLTLIGALGSNVAFRMLLPSDRRVTIGTFQRLRTKLEACDPWSLVS